MHKNKFKKACITFTSSWTTTASFWKSLLLLLSRALFPIIIFIFDWVCLPSFGNARDWSGTLYTESCDPLLSICRLFDVDEAFLISTTSGNMCGEVSVLSFSNFSFFGSMSSPTSSISETNKIVLLINRPINRTQDDQSKTEICKNGCDRMKRIEKNDENKQKATTKKQQWKCVWS